MDTQSPLKETGTKMQIEDDNGVMQWAKEDVAGIASWGFMPPVLNSHGELGKTSIYVKVILTKESAIRWTR